MKIPTQSKKVYMACAEKYNQQCDTKSFGISHKSNAMLGMLDFILATFNAYLSIEAEKVINRRCKVRQADFKKTCE
jgi:hypothetical protein